MGSRCMRRHGEEHESWTYDGYPLTQGHQRFSLVIPSSAWRVGKSLLRPFGPIVVMMLGGDAARCQGQCDRRKKPGWSCSAWPALAAAAQKDRSIHAFRPLRLEMDQAGNVAVRSQAFFASPLVANVKANGYLGLIHLNAERHGSRLPRIHGWPRIVPPQASPYPGYRPVIPGHLASD